MRRLRGEPHSEVKYCDEPQSDWPEASTGELNSDSQPTRVLHSDSAPSASNTSMFCGMGCFDACSNFELLVLGEFVSCATDGIPACNGSMRGVLECPIGGLYGAAEEPLKGLPDSPVLDWPLDPEGHLDASINNRADAARDSEHCEVVGARKGLCRGDIA